MSAKCILDGEVLKIIHEFQRNVEKEEYSEGFAKISQLLKGNQGYQIFNAAIIGEVAEIIAINKTKAALDGMVTIVREELSQMTCGSSQNPTSMQDCMNILFATVNKLPEIRKPLMQEWHNAIGKMKG